MSQKELKEAIKQLSKVTGLDIIGMPQGKFKEFIEKYKDKIPCKEIIIFFPFDFGQVEEQEKNTVDIKDTEDTLWRPKKK